MFDAPRRVPWLNRSWLLNNFHIFMGIVRNHPPVSSRKEVLSNHHGDGENDIQPRGLLSKDTISWMARPISNQPISFGGKISKDIYTSHFTDPVELKGSTIKQIAYWHSPCSNVNKSTREIIAKAHHRAAFHSSPPNAPLTSDIIDEGGISYPPLSIKKCRIDL